MDWHNIYITDKNGGKYFSTNASPMSAMPEIRNLKRHIEQAKRFPGQYKFLDTETAYIVLDGERYADLSAITDDELLAALTN